MLYVLSFFGLIFIFLFIRGFLTGARRKKEMQAAAFSEYMKFKDEVKNWFAYPENQEFRSRADAAIRAINQSVKIIKFTRTSDIKTSKQAATYTYAKEINTLYNIDIDIDMASSIDIGDPIFRDAIAAYQEQTMNETSLHSYAASAATNDIVKCGQHPAVCPKCGYSPVAEIQYGFPDFENEDLKNAVDEGRVVLGGCVIFDSQPEWQCTNCDLQIFRDSQE